MEVDGRRLRRQQNREAVVQAMVDLYGDGVYQPGVAEIAERAGISPRSLFRYFDDVDDLSRAAIEHSIADAQPFVETDVAPSAPLLERIDRLVATRVALHERSAPGARAARVCAHRQPVVAEQVRQARVFLRRQVRRTFAGELEGGDAGLPPVVDVLCSFEAYDLMRQQGLGRAQIVAALTAALTALLDTSGGGR